MKKGVKIVMVISVFILLAAVAYYFLSKKVLKIIFPEVKSVESVHLRLLKDTAFIKAHIRMRNRGFLKLNMDSLIYNIKLDTSTLLSRVQDIDLQLLPFASDTMLLPLALPYKRLIAELKRLQKQDSAVIDLDMKIIYATLFGKATVKYKKVINIEAPLPPEFKITDLHYLKREKEIFYFNTYLKIINKGKLDFDLSAVHYNLIVSDHLKGEGSVPLQIHIKSKTDSLLILPIKVEFDHLIKTILMVISNNDEVNYQLKIKADLKINKPFEENANIEIEKTGRMELRK